MAISTLSAQKPHNYSGERPKGSLSGKIIDAKSKKAVLYASIALYSVRDSSLVTGTMSGDGGSFTIADVPAGKYYMYVKFVGFDKKTINNIMVRPPELHKNLGTIALSPASTSLEGVEITAEKTYVEYKIDRKVVNVGKDLNTSGGTAVEALENVPSVTVDIDGNVQLRGSSSFTVFINGKPTPLSGTDALEQIPVATIKNIEIITNPSAKYDPDGMTGIINVVLKDNIKRGLNGIIDITGSNHEQYGINGVFSYNVGKFNLYFGGNYKHRNSPASGRSELENYFNGDTSFRITDLDRHRSRTNYGIKGGFDFTPDKNNIFTFEGSWGGFDRNKDYSSQIYEYNTPLTYQDYSISQNPGSRFGTYYKISGNWEHKLDSLGSNIQTYAYITNEDEGEDDLSKEFYSDKYWTPTDSLLEGNHTIEDEKAPDYRFKVDLTKYLKNKRRFEAGLQARLRPEYHEITFESFSYDKGWVGLPEYGSNLNFTRNIFSAYATYSGEYKSFGYQLGLRGEETYRNVYDDGKEYSFKINRFDIFPTVHLSKKFKGNNQMLLSYSRRIERPGGWELEPSVRYISSNFMRKGNPELEPEYMDNIELSYQKVINQSFISLEGYYHTTKNKISRIQSVDSTGMVLMTFENLDRDHSAGVELMLNARLMKWLNLNISGNYYYYKLESSGSSLGEINNTSNNFDMRGNITFRIAKNSKLQLSGFYRGASVTAQGERKPFLVTSAAFRQDLFNKKLSLSFRVRDIFSTMKFEFTGYGDNFMSYNSFTHASPVFTLNLTYRINNYKEKHRNGNDEEGEGGEEI
jgi:outer membrane receptor protein involved in Fe transport